MDAQVYKIVVLYKALGMVSIGISPLPWPPNPFRLLYNVKKWTYPPTEYKNSPIYAFATEEWAAQWYEGLGAKSVHAQLWRAGGTVVETSDTRKKECASHDEGELHKFYTDGTTGLKDVPLGTVFCSRLALLECVKDYPSREKGSAQEFGINLTPINQEDFRPRDQLPQFWQVFARYGLHRESLFK